MTQIKDIIASETKNDCVLTDDEKATLYRMSKFWDLAGEKETSDIDEFAHGSLSDLENSIAADFGVDAIEEAKAFVARPILVQNAAAANCAAVPTPVGRGNCHQSSMLRNPMSLRVAASLALIAFLLGAYVSESWMVN